MKWSRLVGGIGAAGVVAAVMVWQGTRFVHEREALRTEVGKLEAATTGFKVTPEMESELRARERALIGSTLGPRPEVVDARLRAGLNQILSACGVVEPVVSARSAAAVRHPATKSVELSGLDGAELTSFATVTATAQGRGTYEQVLAAVATVAAQPWSHRVEQVAITPASKDRSTFALEVVVTTLFVPGQGPQAGGDEGAGENAVLWVGLDDAAQARLARLTRENPFTDPPTAVAAAPQAAPAPAPPSAPVGPAYDQWRITALVQGREGVELWLQRIGSGERRTIRSGETILDARFEGTRAGDAALVRIGGKVFEVALGRTLADRVPVPQ